MEMSNQPAQQHEGGAERRRAARQALVTKGMVYSDQMGSGPRRVVIRDISLLGVGFESAEAVEAGQRVRVRVEAGPMQLACRVRVSSCRAVDEQTYAVGAEFVHNELDADGQRPRGFVEATPSRCEAVPRNPSRDLRPRVTLRVDGR